VAIVASQAMVLSRSVNTLGEMGKHQVKQGQCPNESGSAGKV